MNGMLGHKSTPLFIPSELGALFCMYFSPSSNSNTQCIVHIPAFAEEMNKSRHIVAMQARAFTEQGYSVLVIDLWGTGDSQGDFSEVTWDIWLSNVTSAVNWLQQQGYKSINLWGLRSGALLAIDFINKNSCCIDKLICWQPVLNGEQFLMQFLRLRVAAAMMDKTKSGEKTSDLKDQLLKGYSVEVAGYSLNPKLVIPMLSVKAKQMSLNNVNLCQVFELSDEEELEGSHITTQWIKQLTELGVNISFDVVNGHPFWVTQEILESTRLIKLCSQRLAECH